MRVRVCVCLVYACVRDEEKKNTLIIEFNRRNTVYPKRHKASERDRERERSEREKSLGEVKGDDLGTGR